MRVNVSLRLLVGLVAGFAGGCSMLRTAEPMKPKVLVVMLDGTRADGLAAAQTPNIDRLRTGTWQPGYRGAFSDFSQPVPDARPSSAANHTAIATGASSAKTGLHDNGELAKGLGNWKDWPTWLVRIAAEKKAKSLFVYSWDVDKNLDPDPRVTFIHGSDAENGARMPKILAAPDAPDAILYFIDIPDHAGHTKGFYPHTPSYLQGLAEADRHVGACLDALASRPTFKNEDWLVVITSDHGGQARSHGLWGGSCTTIPLVIAGRQTPDGRLAGSPRNRDVAAWALRHFGFDAAQLNLEARISEAVVSVEKRALKDGLAAYLTFDEKSFANAIPNRVKTRALGPRASFRPVDGKFGGCVSFTGEKGVPGGLALTGSEKLAFEKNANFAVTLWTRLPQDPEGDALVFGNKDWHSGAHPGVGLVSAKCTEGVKVPGIALNAVPGDERPRVDMGTMEIEYGKWTFYAVTCTEDGELVLCQGTSDGHFYWIAERAPALKLATGLPFCIGQDGTGKYPHTLRGDVDDFALWTRALSLDELRQIYEKGRQGIPVGQLIK